MHLFLFENRKQTLYYCVTYRSPNQSADAFEKFLNKLILNLKSVTLEISFLTVAIRNFNARSSKWWTDDKTTQEDLKMKNLLSQFAL